MDANVIAEGKAGLPGRPPAWAAINTTVLTATVKETIAGGMLRRKGRTKFRAMEGSNAKRQNNPYMYAEVLLDVFCRLLPQARELKIHLRQRLHYSASVL